MSDPTRLPEDPALPVSSPEATASEATVAGPTSGDVPGAAPPGDAPAEAPAAVAAEGPPPPPVALAPEVTRPRWGRRITLGVVVLGLVLGGVALALEVASIQREEAALWSQASEGGDESDWTHYLTWAHEMETRPLDGTIARTWTPVRARAALAAQNALTAHVQMAIAHEAWSELCAFREAHPSTRAAADADAALVRRADTIVTAYRARGGTYPTPIALAVADALARTRDHAPCGAAVLVRVRHGFDPASVDLSMHAPGGAGAPTVREMLGAQDDAARTRELALALGPDLERASDGLWHVVTDEDPSASAAVLALEIRATTAADDRHFLTATSVELPGVRMHYALRLLFPASDGTLTSTREARTETDLPEVELPALAIGEARDATALGPIYARVHEELFAEIPVRLRSDLALPSTPGAVARRGAPECADATPLPFGRVVHGSTDAWGDFALGSCSHEAEWQRELDECDDCDSEVYYDETENHEAIYRLVVPRRAFVAVQATPSDGRELVVYLRSECSDELSEIACAADLTPLGAALDEGVYTVIVDETGGSESGDFDLVATMRDPELAPSSCAHPTALVPGEAATGSLSSGRDEDESRCGGVGGREQTFAVSLEAPSHLRCTATSSTDEPLVVALRTDCTDFESESDCAAATTASAALPSAGPGTVFVTVQGERPGATGSYSLRCDVAPVDALDAPSDTCAEPAPLEAGRTSIDTFRAHDDVRTSCGGTASPEVVRRLDVAHPSHVSLRTDTGTGGVALETRCGDATSELGCSIGGPVELDLDPGTYYVVVEGSTPHLGARGVQVDVTDLTPACAALAPVTQGPLVGTVRGGTSLFRGTCASSDGTESIRQLTLTARSRVVVRGVQPFQGSVYLRRTCSDWHSEIACGSDARTDRPILDTVLDAGTYSLFIDTSGSTYAGSYVLDLSIAPVP